MAKRSKRKRSSREDYPLSEQLKIEEGVFERSTMLFLRKLFSRGIISKLEFIIAKGKEADVVLDRNQEPDHAKEQQRSEHEQQQERGGREM